MLPDSRCTSQQIGCSVQRDRQSWIPRCLHATTSSRKFGGLPRRSDARQDDGLLRRRLAYACLSGTACTFEAGAMLSGRRDASPTRNKGSFRQNTSYASRIRSEPGVAVGKLDAYFCGKTVSCPRSPPRFIPVTGPPPPGWAAAERGQAPQDGSDRIHLGSRKRIRAAAWSARPPLSLPCPEWMLGSRTGSSRG